MIARYLRRRRDARARGDRGLAMVEMAIVAPFLALIVAGILEYGTLWRDNLTVTSSSRAAARVVSNLGDNNLSDYEAILSLNSGLSAINGYTLEYVMIYDASALDGQPNPLCFNSSGDPVSNATGNCNVYTGAQVATIAAAGYSCVSTCADFPIDANCLGGLTLYFCPQAERFTDQATGLTSVGIWVRIQRDYFTGIFPGEGVTIEDYAVMKVEPAQ